MSRTEGIVGIRKMQTTTKKFHAYCVNDLKDLALFFQNMHCFFAFGQKMICVQLIRRQQPKKQLTKQSIDLIQKAKAIQKFSQEIEYLCDCYYIENWQKEWINLEGQLFYLKDLGVKANCNGYIAEGKEK